METSTAARNIKRSKGNIKKDSPVYMRQRNMANARKRKFLDSLTAEQIEIKRAKDREYHKRKKGQVKKKKINNKPEQDKQNKKKTTCSNASWQKVMQNYKATKKYTATARSNQSDKLNQNQKTQSKPKDESLTKEVREHHDHIIVRKDGTKSCNKTEALEKRTNHIKEELKYLEEEAQTGRGKEKLVSTTPESEVDDLLKYIHVPYQIQQNDLFGEFVKNTKLQVKADALLKSYKTGEVFEICNIIFATGEQNLLLMAMNILLKEENSDIMIPNSDVKLNELMEFYEQDIGSGMQTFKINCLRKKIC